MDSDTDLNPDTLEKSTPAASEPSTDSETEQEIDQPTEKLTETSIDEPFSDADSDHSYCDLTIVSPQATAASAQSEPSTSKTTLVESEN